MPEAVMTLQCQLIRREGGERKRLAECMSVGLIGCLSDVLVVLMIF